MADVYVVIGTGTRRVYGQFATRRAADVCREGLVAQSGTPVRYFDIERRRSAPPTEAPSHVPPC